MRSLPLSDEERVIVDRFRDHGQGHVFRHLDELAAADRTHLLRQAAEIDLDLVARLAKPAESPAHQARAVLEPEDAVRTEALTGGEIDRARDAGEALLRRGAVAVVLVAGGQGSRLGFAGPKGAYPIGPVTERTLFDWFADRLLALAERHGRPVPLYVMTSAATHEDTISYFTERGHLGLDPADVRFFRQGMVPALDAEGHLLLETSSRVFLSPNGHGGVFEALALSGAFEDMRRRGAEQIFYFQVDNPLVRLADPLFLGLHHLAGAQMSSKVVEKLDPHEAVGVVARRDGRLSVVEYSELSDEQKKAREPGGRLLFRGGNIAIHAIRRDFAERIAASEDLPYHRAHKVVPHVSESGSVVRPESPNATKFERFVFDALPLTERSITLEVPREKEFAPVKNAEGNDSPETARQALTAMFVGWLAEAGVGLKPLVREDVELALEVAPRVALGGSDLARPVPGGDE